MTNRRLQIIAGLCAATTLSGCQTVHSSNVPVSAANDPRGAGDGILYFLPRQLTLVTVKRTDVELDAAIENVEKAVTALAAATATETAAKAAVEATTSQIIAGGHLADALKLLNARLTSNQTDLAAATKAKGEKETALNTARQRLKDIGILRQGKKAVERLKAERRTAYVRLAAANEKAKQARTDLQKAQTTLSSLAPTLDPILQQEAALENKIKLQRAQLDSTPMDSEQLAAARAQILLDESALKDLQLHIAKIKADPKLASAIEDVSKFEGQLKTDQSAAENQLKIAENTNFVERLASTINPLEIEIKYDLSMNISVEEPSPDTNFAFRLSPQHSWLRDDTQKFALSKKGLLTSTDIVAEDRTADVIVELGRLAGAIAGLGVVAPIPVADGSDDDKAIKPLCTDTADSFSQLIDLTNSAEVNDLNGALACYGVQLAPKSSPTLPTAPAIREPLTRDGIFYRTAGEIIVDMLRCDTKDGVCKTNWTVSKSFAFTLPQAGRIGYLSQNAGFATKTKYAAKFSDGMLVDYSSERPSEILQIAGTPIRVIGAVFDGISKVISLRTGNNNALAGLTDSQLAVLNAQAKYDQGQINNQKTLTDAERTLLEARVALQAAEIKGDSALTDAEIERINKQVALQALGISSAAQLTQAQIAVLTKQYELDAARQKGDAQNSAAFAAAAGAQAAAANAQAAAILQANGNIVALSNSELATAIAILRNTSRERSLRQCIERAGPDNIETCLPD